MCMSVSSSSHFDYIFSGHGVVSTDQKSIAISTLYQTAVLYPLTDSGPAVDRGKTYFFRETIGFAAVQVPIALTAGNILLKGTASGEVGVWDSEQKQLRSIVIGELLIEITFHSLTSRNS